MKYLFSLSKNSSKELSSEKIFLNKSVHLLQEIINSLFLILYLHWNLKKNLKLFLLEGNKRQYARKVWEQK